MFDMADFLVNIILFPDTFIIGVILFSILIALGKVYLTFDTEMPSRKNIFKAILFILIISFFWMQMNYNNVTLKQYYLQTWAEIIKERRDTIWLDDLKKLNEQKNSLFLVRNGIALEYRKVPKFLENRVKFDNLMYRKNLKDQKAFLEYKEITEENQKDKILKNYEDK